MKEVAAQGRIQFDKSGNPELQITGLPFKLKELAYTFRAHNGPVDLQVTFRRDKKVFRTNPMLGYLYGHLAPIALQVLNEAGWSTILTKEDAIDAYKELLGFVETDVNEITGEVRRRILSLANTEREQSAQFIQDLYVTLLETGAEVLTPEQYKKRRKYGS